MSVSSNSRKENTESNAAQQMHSTMGIHPELAQLNDKNLENDLPSRVADSDDVDVPGDAEDASADEDNPMRAYRQPTDSMTESDKIADADWNPSTSEGVIPATRANEPDRTLGNS